MKCHADYCHASTETRMAWEPPMDIGGAPAQTQNDEMVLDNNIHHNSLYMDQTSQVAETSRARVCWHFYASPGSTQVVASHGDAGSMGIIQGYTNNTLRDHLVKLKDVLGLPTRCPTCWINFLEPMHNFDHCPEKSKFSSWKGLVDPPQRTCCMCCLPQVGFFSSSYQ